MLQKIVKEKIDNYCWKLQLQSTLFTILSPLGLPIIPDHLAIVFFLKKLEKNVKIRMSLITTRLAENLPSPTFL